MATTAGYPVRVEGALDRDLSRWLWLVKWLLVLPHYIVLAFLWAAFVLMSAVALIAITFTGRYPPSIFAFNVGVMRWSWRVAYYAYGALGTDRYPPFTLAPVPDYPATLEVAYPDHLSRGLAWVKWWLLAIPHYAVVGLLVGGVWFAGDADWLGTSLIGTLVIIAAFVLLFTGRYPTALFDFVLGLNRWVIRVAAYAGLMTDQYPPFRLDMGGSEAPGTLTMPSAPPTGAAARPGGWTGGRIASLIIGILVGLASIGVLAAGGAALWADQTQRDSNGFISAGAERFATGSYAIVSDGIRSDVSGARVAGTVLGDLRVRATSVAADREIFVGIGPTADVEAYLGTVERAVVEDLTGLSRQPEIRTVAGGAPDGPPGARTFWVASSEGAGTRTVTWAIESGSWTLVAMDAGGARGVEVTADLGATIPSLPWFALGLLVGGGLLLLVALLMIVLPVARASRRPPAADPETPR